MNKMNICVIGNSNNKVVTNKTKEFADVIIEYILKNNHNLFSGGCNGIIEYINNCLCKKNKTVTFYSPAFDAKSHNTTYNLNFDKNVDYIFEQDKSKHLSYRFINRSLKMIENSDVIVCFYGMWGTLYELTFAVMLGKKIIFVCEENKNLMVEIYQNVSKLNKYNYNETAFFADSSQNLKSCLEEINQ